MNETNHPLTNTALQNDDPSRAQQASDKQPAIAECLSIPNRQSHDGRQGTSGRDAEGMQRDRWLRFLARQVAMDMLRDRTAKKGGLQ